VEALRVEDLGLVAPRHVLADDGPVLRDPVTGLGEAVGQLARLHGRGQVEAEGAATLDLRVAHHGRRVCAVQGGHQQVHRGVRAAGVGAPVGVELALRLLADGGDGPPELVPQDPVLLEDALQPALLALQPHRALVHRLRVAVQDGRGREQAAVEGEGRAAHGDDLGEGGGAPRLGEPEPLRRDALHARPTGLPHMDDCPWPGSREAVALSAA
jgi:hypothetical protein